MARTSLPEGGSAEGASGAPSVGGQTSRFASHRAAKLAPMTTTVLDREMYTKAEAARLLRVSPSTLHYWLEGGERRNKTYQPIIRPRAPWRSR